MHPLNAQFPIDVTFGGIEIDFNDMHSLNDPFPIDFNDDGIITSCKLEQLLNK